MQRLHSIAALLSVFFGIGIGVAPGCGKSDCSEVAECEPERCADLDTPQLVAQYGEKFNCPKDGGGVVPGCVPRLLEEGAVEDFCGVFVSPTGSEAGAGTKTDPVNSLTVALQKSIQRNRRVYACVGTFTETIEVPGAAEVYGGLDCVTWQRVGGDAKTVLTAEADKIPLTLSRRVFDAQPPAVVEDLHVMAADAQTEGGSSIAAVADEATVRFEGVVLEAGKGKAGEDGASLPTAAPSGEKGTQGGQACSATTVIGGGETTNRCGAIASVGGLGGNGSQSSGTSGGSGQPGADNFGKGEDVNGGCENGKDGAVGNDGAPGIGRGGPRGADRDGVCRRCRTRRNAGGCRARRRRRWRKQREYQLRAEAAERRTGRRRRRLGRVWRRRGSGRETGRLELRIARIGFAVDVHGAGDQNPGRSAGRGGRIRAGGWDAWAWRRWRLGACAGDDGAGLQWRSRGGRRGGRKGRGRERRAFHRDRVPRRIASRDREGGGDRGSGARRRRGNQGGARRGGALPKNPPLLEPPWPCGPAPRMKLDHRQLEFHGSGVHSLRIRAHRDVFGALRAFAPFPRRKRRAGPVSLGSGPALWAGVQPARLRTLFNLDAA